MRASRAAALPIDRFEPLQLQKYDERGLYMPHYDSDGANSSAARAATWIFYLSDVGGGGETVFPRRRPESRHDFEQLCSQAPTAFCLKFELRPRNLEKL